MVTKLVGVHFKQFLNGGSYAAILRPAITCSLCELPELHTMEGLMRRFFGPQNHVHSLRIALNARRLV